MENGSQIAKWFCHSIKLLINVISWCQCNWGRRSVWGKEIIARLLGRDQTNPRRSWWESNKEKHTGKYTLCGVSHVKERTIIVCVHVSFQTSLPFIFLNYRANILSTSASLSPLFSVDWCQKDDRRTEQPCMPGEGWCDQELLSLHQD